MTPAAAAALLNQKKQQKICSRVPTQGYNYKIKQKKIKNNYLSMG